MRAIQLLPAWKRSLLQMKHRMQKMLIHPAYGGRVQAEKPPMRKTPCFMKSKQQNQKMYQVGEQHPDRDARFCFINETSAEFLANGEPVISIDTKKKENVGNFKNNGAEYRPAKSSRKVLDHDFPLPEPGKVSPYGVYVLNDNTGFVNLGISHDTPEFAGESVAQWWRCVGKHTFPDAKRLYITCDSGGSNGCRIWLKKQISKLSLLVRMKNGTISSGQMVD